MTPYLRRGGALSFAVHIVVMLAVVVALPKPKLPDQPVEETVVTVEFETPTPVQRAPTPAVTPAPAPAPTAAPGQSVPDTPLPTPPLPTPPPLPPAPAPPIAIPPVPAPAPTLTTPAPRPPTPALEQIAPAPLPPPPVPPTLRASPAPPVTQPVPPAPPPRPAPPTQAPAPPANSAASQPNQGREPAPDTKSLDSALDRLRAQLATKDPPRAPPNPARGGAPGGGSPTGLDNALLTAGVRRAIGDRLRECWTGDRSALDYDKQVVRLVVTTDATGTIRIADIAANDASRTGNGVARAFAERAKRAALDPQCAQLPLPAALKGQNRSFEITFRP